MFKPKGIHSLVVTKAAVSAKCSLGLILLVDIHLIRAFLGIKGSEVLFPCKMAEDVVCPRNWLLICSEYLINFCDNSYRTKLSLADKLVQYVMPKSSPTPQ